MTKKRTTLTLAFVLGLFLPFFMAGNALAHCDTMDGPVIKDAQKALETGDISKVLIWVKKDGEAEIREAFKKTLEVRKLGPKARDLADMYFFETLVRVHRAGEGAPYTGVKPAGAEVDHAILASDAAIEKGTVAQVNNHLGQVVKQGVDERFERVMQTKNFAKDDIAAGREYVEAYVVFMHYVEGLFKAAGTEAAHGAGEAQAAPAPHAH